jgi:hypothetical protein
VRVESRFDDAWTSAIDHASNLASQGVDVVVVRDILGRSTLVLDDRGESLEIDLDQSRRELHRSIAPFSPGEQECIILGTGLFSADSIFLSPELVEYRTQIDGSAGYVKVLERTVVGIDWSRNPAADSKALSRRITLYGFKGGVGRSTATAILARHLANTGRCVLVIDLDLESPGVSSLLEDPSQLPANGVVDHLVETAVGGGDGLELVTKSQVVPVQGNGEVWLAPACGRPREQYDYLAKLNRIYADLPPTQRGLPAKPFSQRLADTVTACEAAVEDRSRAPDVVLIDSRAGIHDIAAVAIGQLSGLSLLFAVDNPGTWDGYRMLFEQWQKAPVRAESIRERLRLVAAMTHATDHVARLAAIRDNAQETFSVLYDDETSPDSGAFNPSVDDESAPHSPIEILFTNDLVGLNPRNRDWMAQPFVTASYRNFLSKVEALCPPLRSDHL